MAREYSNFYRFLNCCQGNWRNAIFITCPSCPYPGGQCAGYLLAMEKSMRPILYPVDRLQQLSGETISKDECIGTLNRQAFEALVRCWMIWHLSESQGCSIRQIMGQRGDL